MDLFLEMKTGMTAQQKATNRFYKSELDKCRTARLVHPVTWCHRTRTTIPRPNWDIRQACNPDSCKVNNTLKNRYIPVGEFTRALEFLIKTHDSSRVPATDDPVCQAVHLTRRACTELLCYAEALNECMLAVSNIVAGLPEESWFIPVIMRWKTIRICLDDTVNGINSAARIFHGKMNCRSAKRFTTLMKDRQQSLPLPENFAKTDSSSFVPGLDFQFMCRGPGSYKSKAQHKTVDPKIEMQAVPIKPGTQA